MCAGSGSASGSAVREGRRSETAAGRAGAVSSASVRPSSLAGSVHTLRFKSAPWSLVQRVVPPLPGFASGDGVVVGRVALERKAMTYLKDLYRRIIAELKKHYIRNSQTLHAVNTSHPFLCCSCVRVEAE